MMRLGKKIFIGLFLLVLVLIIEKYTDIDLLIQDRAYDFMHHEWLIDEYTHDKLGIIFYKGIKYFDMILGILLFISFLLSFIIVDFKQIRKPVLVLLLSLTIVPFIIASAKEVTNVYCPKQLAMYDGDKPFVRIVDHYPADFKQDKPGRCFPAAHATAGFALMALYFCFNDKKAKIAGLSVGITLGWIAGLYQMFRGQHFFSHTVFSMIASFMIIMLIDYVINKRWRHETI